MITQYHQEEWWCTNSHDIHYKHQYRSISAESEKAFGEIYNREYKTNGGQLPTGSQGSISI